MGLLGSLFGGSKSKNSSSTSNKAFEYLQGALSPGVAVGANAMGSLGDVVSGGFDQYKANAGFDNELGEGLQGITGAGAAGGLLRSGSTAKALTRYQSDLGSKFYTNWLDRLSGIAGQGTQNAGVIAGAGQVGTSTGKGSSNGGILSTLFG